MNEPSNAEYQDVAKLVLGGILFMSPWLLAFEAGAASQNAIVCGILIALLSAFTACKEWLSLAAGLWVIVSPWILGLEATTAVTVHLIIGLIVAVLAAVELWLMYQNPPRQTATR